MKKGITIITMICYLCFFNISLAANTHSIDLELSSSQYLSITDGDQTGLDLTGDLAFEAWVKLETNSTWMTVLSKSIWGTDIAYYFRITAANKLAFEVSDDGTWDAGHRGQWYTTNAVITSTGTWYHITITYDASGPTVVFYVDGVAQTTAISNTVTSIYSGAGPFAIGTNAHDLGYYFDGLVDEVRVWNDVRTPTEISDNYEKELNGNEAGLVAYYKLNDSLLDETSNDNDLTNNNSATFSTDVPFVGAVRRIIMVE